MVDEDVLKGKRIPKLHFLEQMKAEERQILIEEVLDEILKPLIQAEAMNKEYEQQLFLSSKSQEKS